MQEQSNLDHTASRRTGRSLQNDALSFDGEHVAKIFKYYRRLQNPYVSQTLPLKLVSGKALYKAHKEEFDRFAKLAVKNRFDVERYIKYCVKCGIRESSVLVCIASTTMIDKYLMHVKVYNKRKKIYKWFLKSARNIANECIKEGYSSCREWLREVIRSGKVVNYVVSGKISLYFFAAIPHFDKAISKLDYFSQQAFCLLKDHYETYHSEVNKAFLQSKNCKVNPITFTDNLIAHIE